MKTKQQVRQRIKFLLKAQKDALEKVVQNTNNRYWRRTVLVKTKLWHELDSEISTLKKVLVVGDVW